MLAKQGILFFLQQVKEYTSFSSMRGRGEPRKDNIFDEEQERKSGGFLRKGDLFLTLFSDSHCGLDVVYKRRSECRI